MGSSSSTEIVRYKSIVEVGVGVSLVGVPRFSPVGAKLFIGIDIGSNI